MNITKETTGDLSALLKVEVIKADYQESVEKVLRDYRKKASVKGFRPGMVPIGLIKKMYGKAVQFDEINKLVSESIKKYLADEKIDILGDPLPKADENETIDFEKQEDFTFRFELGLAPRFDLMVGKNDSVGFYEITIDEKMRNDYVSNYARRFGEFRIADVSADKDLLKGSIAEIDENGTPLPEGISNNETSLAVNVI